MKLKKIMNCKFALIYFEKFSCVTKESLDVKVKEKSKEQIEEEKLQKKKKEFLKILYKIMIQKM